ncbi:MAG: alpha/beta hydrolase [Pseudomonadota bacterium]
MSSSLIASRDRFSQSHPEELRKFGEREWGCIRAGSAGPSLVLLPGTLGRADIFWQQIEALEHEARILALSYPAAGGISDWSDDIAAMVRKDNLQDATILGSSLGGYVAQETSASHPDLISALVAANTLPDASIVSNIPPYALDLETVEIEVLANGFLNGLRTWMTDGHPYCYLAELLVAEVEGRIPEKQLRNRLIALKEAPKLPRQTLTADSIYTVESDDDHLIPPPVRSALRDALKPAKAFNMGDASHFPYVTKPDMYIAMLREVLGLTKVDG